MAQTVSVRIPDWPAPNGRLDYGLIFTLDVIARGDFTHGIHVNGVADLQHTAIIRQTLSPGWTFESDSGLLSESPLNSPVPEPSTAWLPGVALLLIIAARLLCCRNWCGFSEVPGVNGFSRS